MRDKLESLPLSVLKDIAKDKQVKHYSTMKKAELIDILVKLSELEAADEETGEAETDTPKVSEEKVSYSRREIPEKRGSNEEYTGQGCIAYIHNRLDQCPETQNAYMMQLYIETRCFCDFINGKRKDF